MKIAVHSTPRDETSSFSHRWIKLLKEKDVNFVTVDMEDPDIVEKIKGCDGVMWHWSHMPREKNSANKILDGIEASGCVRIYPNLQTRWHYDEKVSQCYLLKSMEEPIVPTQVFWNKNKALDYLENAEYPLIFKLSVGAGSSNVLKIKNKYQAKRLCHKMFDWGVTPYTMNEFSIKMLFSKFLGPFKKYFVSKYPVLDYFILQKNYLYVQDYLPNDYDIRVTIIGKRAFGFTRMNRTNDFRASGSGKIIYDLSKVPIEAIKIAFEISKKQNFQSMAYDFLLNKSNSPVIGEISYCFNNKAVYNCEGYWDDKLEWHKGHSWPEDLILEDFIDSIQKNEK